jgi:hypothetical protein
MLINLSSAGNDIFNIFLGLKAYIEMGKGGKA